MLINLLESSKAIGLCPMGIIHQFKRVFWVLKRTVSLRRFF